MTTILPKDMNKIDIEPFNRMILRYLKKYNIGFVSVSNTWMTPDIQSKFLVHINKSIINYDETNSHSQNIEPINWFVETTFTRLGFDDRQVNIWFYSENQNRLEKILLDILKKTYYMVPTNWLDENWKIDDD